MKFAQEEAVFGNKKLDYAVPFKVEYSLVKLLNRELELGKSLQEYINLLSLRSDFNAFKLFNMLDNFKYNFIAKEK